MPKKSRLPEAHQTGAAHQQFQAQRKDGVDHDFVDQVDAKLAPHPGIGQQGCEGTQHKKHS